MKNINELLNIVIEVQKKTKLSFDQSLEVVKTYYLIDNIDNIRYELDKTREVICDLGFQIESTKDMLGEIDRTVECQLRGIKESIDSIN